jgi:hypothetical protein
MSIPNSIFSVLHHAVSSDSRLYLKMLNFINIVEPSLVMKHLQQEVLYSYYRQQCGPILDNAVEIPEAFKSIDQVDAMHRAAHPDRRESFAMTIDFINGMPDIIITTIHPDGSRDHNFTPILKRYINFFIEQYLCDITPPVWTRPIINIE